MQFFIASKNHEVKILAIATKYKHHAKNGGYIQLAEHLNPTYLIGIDETKERQPHYLFRAYKWLYEFVAFLRFRRKIDLIHIYYGEEYFRFSTLLFPNIPVIATFHQPPTRLRYEIEKGGTGGRIARWAHRLAKNRFQQLAAAIVLEEQQKEILSRVMPAERIHVIYHGIDVAHYEPFRSDSVAPVPNQIITVGNWLRDWAFYKEVIATAQTKQPDLKFILVNRSLNEDILEELRVFPNFSYKTDVSDQGLIQLLQESKVHFLPLIEATANNSVMESLAVGCPLVMPGIFSNDYQLSNSSILFFERGKAIAALEKILTVMEAAPDNYQSLLRDGYQVISRFDWKQIAKSTREVYRTV